MGEYIKYKKKSVIVNHVFKGEKLESEITITRELNDCNYIFKYAFIECINNLGVDFIGLWFKNDSLWKIEKNEGDEVISLGMDKNEEVKLSKEFVELIKKVGFKVGEEWVV